MNDRNGDDEGPLWLLRLLRRRRDEPRRVQVARLTAALGAALAALGTGTPLIALLGLLFLWTESPRPLAVGSAGGVLIASALLIGAVLDNFPGHLVALNASSAALFTLAFLLARGP